MVEHSKVKIPANIIIQDIKVAMLVGLNFTIRKEDIKIDRKQKAELLSISLKTYYRILKVYSEINFNTDIERYTYIDGGIFFKGLSRNALKIYLILSYFKNHKNRLAFPSVRLINKYSKMNFKNIYTALNELEANNVIKCYKKEGKEVYYFVIY